jgi:citrate synthase
MLGMIYQTSKLHPMTGINYRGHDLFEVMKQCPTSEGGLEPLPEAILWLLLTSEFPTKSNIEELQADLYERGKLTTEQENLIK